LTLYAARMWADELFRWPVDRCKHPKCSLFTLGLR
jgi:hypothetical protein